MSVDIQVNGVNHPLRERSLVIEHKVNERSTASFVLVTEGADNIRINKREPVRITSEGTVIFTGYVDVVAEVQKGTMRLHSITCIDNHYLADKRIFAKSFTDTTVTAIVEAIATEKLSEEGVTFTAESIDGGTALVKAQSFNYRTVSDCLDKLAERSGCDWWIDQNKVLWFKKLNDKPVGKTVTSDMIRYNSLQVKNTAHLYRNRQVINGGRSITDPRTESQFGDGEKAVFTTGFPIAKKPAISIDDVPVDPDRIGIKGLNEDDGSKDWFWTSGSTEVVQASAGTRLTSGGKFTITYQGYFKTVIISQDSQEISSLKNVDGSTGIVEAVDNEPNLDDKDAIFEMATAKLEKHRQPSQSLTFTTLESDFEVGQVVMVNLPEEWIENDPDYLVDSISVSDDTSMVWYTVRLVKGHVHKSWQKALMSLSNEAVEELIDMDNVEIVILPTTFEHKWKESETPNTMRVTKVGSYRLGQRIGMNPQHRNTKMVVRDAEGTVLGEIPATQRTIGATKTVTVFVVPQSEAVGTWATVDIYGGWTGQVKFLTLVETRVKTHLDEIQIQLTDYKNW